MLAAAEGGGFSRRPRGPRGPRCSLRSGRPGGAAPARPEAARSSEPRLCLPVGPSACLPGGLALGLTVAAGAGCPLSRLCSRCQFAREWSARPSARLRVPLAAQGPSSRLECPHLSPSALGAPGRRRATAEEGARGRPRSVALSVPLDLVCSSRCLSLCSSVPLSLCRCLSLSPYLSPSHSLPAPLSGSLPLSLAASPSLGVQSPVSSNCSHLSAALSLPLPPSSSQPRPVPRARSPAPAPAPGSSPRPRRVPPRLEAPRLGSAARGSPGCGPHASAAAPGRPRAERRGLSGCWHPPRCAPHGALNPGRPPPAPGETKRPGRGGAPAPQGAGLPSPAVPPPRAPTSSPRLPLRAPALRSSPPPRPCAPAYLSAPPGARSPGQLHRCPQ